MSPLDKLRGAADRQLLHKTTRQIATLAGFEHFTPGVQTVVELVMLRRGWRHVQPKFSSYYPDSRKVWAP